MSDATMELRQLEAELNCYRRAWAREVGSLGLVPKTHEIDALVLTTRELKDIVRAECAEEMMATVTRTDVVALAEKWSKSRWGNDRRARGDGSGR